jgi:hypothetical protein
MRFRSIITTLLALVVVISALYLWRRPRPGSEVPEREQDVVLAPVAEPTLPPPRAPLPPPALSEVQPTLDRVFAQTLRVDPAVSPAFVAGDFNGDEVPDLAVAVRPKDEGSLPRLNDRLASWGLQDAAVPPPPPPDKPQPVLVTLGDRLLAVVHGSGIEGWRSPETLQGYLVKNAVGPRLQPRPLAGVPDGVRMQVTRDHVGDVIATSRSGGAGLVVWTGARYLWADLKGL